MLPLQQLKKTRCRSVLLPHLVQSRFHFSLFPLHFLTSVSHILVFIQTEDDFSWVDGSPFNFTNWNGNEGQVTKANQDCVRMRTNRGGGWGDYDCSDRRGFLCRESKALC